MKKVSSNRSDFLLKTCDSYQHMLFFSVNLSNREQNFFCNNFPFDTDSIIIHNINIELNIYFSDYLFGFVYRSHCLLFLFI